MNENFRAFGFGMPGEETYGFSQAIKSGNTLYVWPVGGHRVGPLLLPPPTQKAATATRCTWSGLPTTPS